MRALWQEINGRKKPKCQFFGGKLMAEKLVALAEEVGLLFTIEGNSVLVFTWHDFRFLDCSACLYVLCNGG